MQQWHCKTSVSKCDLCILKTLLHLCIMSFFIYLFIWCCISSFSSLALFVVLPFFPWIIFLGGLWFIFTFKSSLAHTERQQMSKKKQKQQHCTRRYTKSDPYYLKRCNCLVICLYQCSVIPYIRIITLEKRTT